jgi:Ca2+-binding EF-hand superfamily protein
MAAKLPEQSIEDMRQTFITMDINGDGRIQHEEFRNAIKSSGVNMNEDELKNIISTLDMNGNGYIDYTEFLAGCMDQNVFLNEANLRQAFSYFDKVSVLLFVYC